MAATVTLLRAHYHHHLTTRHSMSNVRGPTSALTEFLRSQGITARNTNRFRRRDAPPEEPQPAAATPDNDENEDEDEDKVVASSSTTARRRRAARPGASMNFDEEDESDPDDQATSTPSSSKKPRKNTDKDEYRPSSSAAGPSSSARNVPLRPPGSIVYCGMCKSKFTVTKYTQSSPKGPLCHRCAASCKKGEQDATAGPKPKKRGPPRRRIGVLDGSEKREVPSLQSSCIDVISRYIDSVEALGDIGLRNMDAISRAISRNRRLTPRTLQLFLLPEITTLSLYDCSKLDGHSLASLATFTPRITDINLQLCGQLDDVALQAWTRLPLRSVELYGPYLIRAPTWIRFLESRAGQLHRFAIRESPRFNLDCANALVKHHPELRELALAQIGPLDATMLEPLQALTRLEHLDISDPGVSAPGVPPLSLPDTAVIALLKSIGTGLTYLDLSKNADLTDETAHAIAASCSRLKQLRLASLAAVTSPALTSVLTANGDLKHLVLDRMTALTDEIMQPLTALPLTHLSLNSVDSLTTPALRLLGRIKSLQHLDLGFCRALDDETLLALCDELPRLQVVYVFGCNRVSDFARSDRVRIVGKQRYAAT